MAGKKRIFKIPGVCICGKKDCQIPYGTCHCGCGETTNIAIDGDSFHGYIGGEPKPYKRGHTEKHFKAGESNPFFGKKHSLETRIKISLANGGNGNVSPGDIKSNKAKRTAEWRERNRDRILEYDQRYLDKRGRYRHDRYHLLREKVLETLGSQCCSDMCRWLNEDGTLGCKDKRLLQIDHVRGGGTNGGQRRDGVLLLLDVLSGKFDGEYQILCVNCNWIKRHTNKEVPVSKFNRAEEVAC